MSEQQWHQAPGQGQYPNPQQPAAQPAGPPPWAGYSAPPYQQTGGAPWPGPLGQALYPPPPAPAKPRRSRRGPALALLGAGVALVMVVIALLIPGGGPAGAPGSGSGAAAQLKTLWAVPNSQGRKITDMSGSWSTGSLVIDARVDGAVAYALTNGEQAWGWQVPEGLEVCAMATSVSEGIGVLGYGDTSVGGGGGCDHLAGIDVATGKQAWTINLDPQPNAPDNTTHIMTSNPHIAVSGGDLAAVSEDNTLSSFDLKTGSLRWRTADELGNLADDCVPQGVQALAGTVYEASTCTDLGNGGSQSLQLQGYRAAASAAPAPSTLSTTGISGSSYVELWASGAWMFLTTGGASGAGQALGYPVGEGATSPVALDLTGYNADAFGSSTSGQLNPRGFAVAGDTLYIEDQMSGAEYGASAVNLKTGKRIWDQKLGGNAEVTVLSADAAGVHTVVSVEGQGTNQLVTLAAASGAPSYGPSTHDARFIIDSSNTVTLQGTYLIDVSSMSIGSMPAVVVLSGATG